MWFIKSELRKQIDKYDKDKDILLAFARSVQKPRIEEITLDDVKSFYTSVVALKNGQWERNSYMLAVRKFFKYYRGQNVIKWQSVTDNPLISVVQSDMLEPMKKKPEKKAGRPPNIEMIKKVKVLREQAGLSYRKIGAAIGKDSRQAFMWYEASKAL